MGGLIGSTAGKDDNNRTEPTEIKTNSPISLTIGCFCKGVLHVGQIGVTPLGGLKTMAGPQQQVGHRKRGKVLTRLVAPYCEDQRLPTAQHHAPAFPGDPAA